METIGIVFVIKKLLTWRSMVDIVLVTAGLFFLYRTVIRLGTWKIVTGIGLAFAVFFGASLLNLRGISWIYSNVSQVAVIALLIIFQPELRKILERASSMRRVEGGDFKLDLSRMLAEALLGLARQKRGAIIVIPGREPVSEWIKGGQPLDATPSLPIIMSIFDPHSPGHDGALVVKNGKLTRFGGRLPISQSAGLPETYGTRHHAAMGLSERSDALVLVVSEERGQVSLFRQGIMTIMDEGQKIIDAILSHWQETATYAFDVRQGLLRGPALSQLAVSFVFAVIFLASLIVNQSEFIEKELVIPIQYVSAPADLVLMGQRVNEIRVRLAGEKSDMDSLVPDQLWVSLDLSSAVAGSQTFALSEQNLSLPKGVQLVDMDPSIISLTLAAVVEQELYVKPQLVGKLADNLRLEQVTVIPEKVKARLPVTEAKEDRLSVTTTPIYLGTIREDTSVLGKIIAPSVIQPVDKNWPDVEVIVRVKAK
jgi:diadenylate cyclase